jgi:hypothetical protein
MLEMDWGKLLVIGLVTATVMAPRYWDAMDRWINQVRRSWS